MPSDVGFEVLPSLKIKEPRNSIESTLQAVRNLMDSLRNKEQSSFVPERVEKPKSKAVESPSDFWD